MDNAVLSASRKTAEGRGAFADRPFKRELAAHFHRFAVVLRSAGGAPTTQVRSRAPLKAQRQRGRRKVRSSADADAQ
jgi:hypothetical protein